MFKKYFGIAILLVLAYWFWISPNFSEISAWVAIFLFGMFFLSDWFKYFTWGTLERLLEKFTDKTWKWLLFGFSSATIMQSSSLVSILTISFLNAEIITLLQGIWVIFWANIWTTTGIWLMAIFWLKVKISAYAMPMLAFWVIFALQKSRVVKAIGSIVAGLWFLFLWIHYMKEGFELFWLNIDLLKYSTPGFLWVLLFTIIWIVATVVMQSSHASIILIITALATNQVSYENALALVIWANIGTTITALLGSINSNINWKRLALADIIFKISTWIIFILFLKYVILFINFISWYIWIADIDYVLKIAVFHTLFNVIWVILIIPFIKQFEKLVVKILRDRKTEEDYENTAKYLTEESFDFPDTSIIALTKESQRLFRKVLAVILETFWLDFDDINLEKYSKKELLSRVLIDKTQIDTLYENKIKNLYWEIISYAVKSQLTNEKTHYEDFRTIKYANIDIVETVKNLRYLKRHFSRFLMSKNQIVKKEYEKIIYDLIFVISYIVKLSETENDMEKIRYLAIIEKYIEENDIIKNGKISAFMKNPDIEDHIATSLIKDTNYKNDILNKLLLSAEIIFNRNISDEHKKKKQKSFFKNMFWLSNKKLDKIISKFENRKSYLKAKKKKEDNKQNIASINKEIAIVDFILDKYGN